MSCILKILFMFVMSNSSNYLCNASFQQAKQTNIPDTRVQVPSFSECVAFGGFDSDLGFFIYPKSFFMSNPKNDQNGEAHATLTRKLEQTLTQFFRTVTSDGTLSDVWIMLKHALASSDDEISHDERRCLVFTYERLKELLPDLENLTRQINQLKEEE
jgi:hypothetical protein